MLEETKSRSKTLNGLSTNGLKKINYEDANEKGIFINNIVARWTKEIQEPTLGNITTFVKPGQLLAVVGGVGSGKVIKLNYKIF